LTTAAKVQGRPLREAITWPLFPPAARPAAWVLTVCCAITIAGLPILFAHHSGLNWLDRSVDPRIQGMYRAHHDLLPWLARPGDLIPVAALIVIIAVTCLVTGRLNVAVLAVVAVPMAVELTERVFKPAFSRTKLGFLSYPSGHATSMFALAAVLAVLMVNPPGRALTRAVRVVVPAAAAAVACVVSTAMIALGFHYFTDTIAGAAVGIGTVTATALAIDLPGSRRWLAAASRQLRKLHTRRSNSPGSGAVSAAGTGANTAPTGIQAPPRSTSPDAPPPHRR
jgi:membrane-associated phospholipid phosphatase